MKKRAFILGALALPAMPLPALAADDLGSHNKSLLQKIQDDILYSQLLAYVNSVISAVKSGSYSADSLAVAYMNLNAIKSMTRGKTGGRWDLLSRRVDEALEAVINAFYNLEGTDDIATHGEQLKDESISPYIGKAPEIGDG